MPCQGKAPGPLLQTVTKPRTNANKRFSADNGPRRMAASVAASRNRQRRRMDAKELGDRGVCRAFEHGACGRGGSARPRVGLKREFHWPARRDNHLGALRAMLR